MARIPQASQRVILEGLRPEIDCGRFPIKRAVGEDVVVEVDMFAEGHDELEGVLRFRPDGEESWTEVPLRPLGNDRWRASFRVTRPGGYSFQVQGWPAPFRTWRRDLGKRLEAGQEVGVDLEIGANLLDQVSGRAGGTDRGLLRKRAALLRSKSEPVSARVEAAREEGLAAACARNPDRSRATTYPRDGRVVVDSGRARFGAWYEMFPRSCSPDPGRPGTLLDCRERLAYVAELGFDVVYLPPIHPIGIRHRKGRNNALRAAPSDPGSPWAIGSAEGGHRELHPELGTLEDLDRLMDRARELDLEVALDIAYQCSPDHPWVREHPEWFRHRPDGTIQYAENPPKKYQDILPLDFDTEDWKALWEELLGVVFFWMERGVRIFRVDNPHTKPFAFWEWLIGRVREKDPGVIFLSEAFTRPRIMYRLAKLGFSQSYTYFAWRNTKRELTEYFTELTGTEIREYFRPNLWPNTPDILTEYLQYGGRPAFQVRLILAGTLAASYGIYGPVFELCENRAREPGSEEYLDSEKYEVRHWDLDRPESLRHLVARFNRVRRENPALQSDRNLRFHHVDNEQLIAYSKHTPDFENILLTVVNLDPHHTHSGWVDFSLPESGLEPGTSYQVHDLLSDARFLWEVGRNYVELNPAVLPAHLFRIRKRLRTETDFDYFL